MEKTLGGDRIGSGKKMQVHLHGYERSSHDLGKLWRSTMSAGTVVPFYKRLVLPGDTFDMHLDCVVKTHPTIGPLFGSYKVQLDLFTAPVRLYNAMLHNNALNIGMDMAQVKLPQIELTAIGQDLDALTDDNINTSQINPSSLLPYLGIRGIGLVNTVDGSKTRQFNALGILMYWDTIKNYYVNKQEEIGAVIHTPSTPLIDTVDTINIENNGVNALLAEDPGTSSVILTQDSLIIIAFTGTQPDPAQIIITTSPGGQNTAAELFTNFFISGIFLVGLYDHATWGDRTGVRWRMTANTDTNDGLPAVATFPLANLDEMRNKILQHPGATVFLLNDADLEPYKWLYEIVDDTPTVLSSQEGLALKTYQSDLLQNWVKTEWITGPGGINELTAVSTVGDSFNIDTLIIQNKVYKMLMRVAVAGGSYNDWQDAIWAHDRYKQCETPMYMGGLIKELIFQEVVSNSASETQPLATLAGKGVMANKHKGGKVVIKVDEPSYILGLVSITPRIDYSQGNDWDVNLKTMNDLHKPALDEIGFQDSINERRAWWTTQWDTTEWIQTAAGKQPAWIEYMTDINEVHGNFAMPNNEMFMTLNRRYEYDETTTQIKDLTTYIDPSKFNFIFAETALDAQNFWVQIALDITARRKMSGKLMPNL